MKRFVVLAACAVLASPSLAAGEPERAAAVAAFDTIRNVLQHPRCQSCHIPGDAPILEDGQPHGQNVKRGTSGLGADAMRCSTCHGESNPPASYGPHTPPGAPGWHLPPERQKMVFMDLSAADLCRQVKDPKRNGGKDLAAFLKHVEGDKLVLWGWDPGAGREKVSVPHADFVSAVKSWIAAGAPCPATGPAPSANALRSY